MIGLKGYRKLVKGKSFRYKLSTLKDEIGWAWQRLWYGYDDRMWYSLDHYFVKTYKPLLVRLKDNLHGCPYGMSIDEWETILGVMISLLDIMEDGLNDSSEQAEKAKDEFFRLFSKYFYDLWD